MIEKTIKGSVVFDGTVAEEKGFEAKVAIPYDVLEITMDIVEGSTTLTANKTPSQVMTDMTAGVRYLSKITYKQSGTIVATHYYTPELELYSYTVDGSNVTKNAVIVAKTYIKSTDKVHVGLYGVAEGTWTIVATE